MLGSLIQSPLESKRIRVAVKPYDEPLRKGEILTFSLCRSGDRSRRLWLTGIAVCGTSSDLLRHLQSDVGSLETYTEFTHLKSLSIAVNALTAAGDLLIATTLCIVLHQP
ncbi:hypothetical protein P691DRAFT_769570 [Macrolepiota fuliginosa MF-IS2]|uniref:Uncharacterized protein n=1 Tax=Macrolepiota fuliginosa MF-IS2 TaxID=1400762 RepID=A0A9P6BUR0_9AGAR|nr:hypothetical protein P691DRAFT_769570 [Macrolepiota fuliginosa MF-IS2]